MKILHLGAALAATGALAKYQLKAGHDVGLCLSSHFGSKQLALPFSPPAAAHSLGQICEEHYQVIHIHGATGLQVLRAFPDRQGDWRQTMSLLVNNGSSVVVTAQTEDSFSTEELTQLPWDLISHVFVDNPLASRPEIACKNCSLLTYAIDFEFIPVFEPKPTQAQDLKLLHIDQATSPSELKQIQSYCETLWKKGLKFSFESRSASEISNIQKLRQLMSTYHLLIEGIANSHYGNLAIESLALGIPVLSMNNPQFFDQWPIYRMSPVQSGGIEKFDRKLESIIREPRCLFDFAKRSRAFAEQNHNAEYITRTLLIAYSNLSAPATSTAQALL